MTAKTPKELDAIDARLRVLIPELPQGASPTRKPQHAQIVIGQIISDFSSDTIAQSPLEVSELAMALLDVNEIIG